MVFLRHGQTSMNASNLLQGSKSDSPLNDIGISQSQSIGNYIQEHFEIERVITSPLKRCIQTLEHAGMGGIETSYDSRFLEIDYGEYEAQPVLGVAKEMIKSWSTDLNYKPEGGESLNELYERVSLACEDLVADFKGQTLLICSHATPIKAAMVWAICGLPEVILKIHSHTATISVVSDTEFGRVLLGYNESPSV